MKVTEVPQIKIPEDKKDMVIMVAAFGWLQDLSEEGYVTKEELRYLAEKYEIPVVV